MDKIEIETTPSISRGGRPASVTDEEVIAVGERLQAEGKRVSGYLLKANLGGVGRQDRYTDIWTKHLAARQASQSEPAAQVVAAPQPAEIRAAVEAMQMSVGSAAEVLVLAVQRYEREASAQRISDADRRTEEADKALKEAEDAGESFMQSARSDIDRLTSERDAALKAAADADHARQVAEGVALERKEKLVAAEDRERAARDHVSRLTAQVEQAADLRRQLDEALHALRDVKSAEESLHRELAAAHADLKGIEARRLDALEDRDAQARKVDDMGYQLAAERSARAAAEAASAAAQEGHAKLVAALEARIADYMRAAQPAPDQPTTK